MSKIVRSSKFSNVFGAVAKKEDVYDELKITRSSWDSNFIACSTTMFAVCWEAAGGGSFAVVPFSKTGKWSASWPLYTGHKAAVIDLDFNPFNDNMVASASEDATVKIWVVPEGGLADSASHVTTYAQNLVGHKRKLCNVKFHPTANNVLASGSTDTLVKLWDIEKGDSILDFDGHTDLINSIDWNANGSLIASSCKDKKIRVADPRKKGSVLEALAHDGVKGSRICFLPNNRLFSVGFTKNSEREYCLWDERKMDGPLTRVGLDSASGLIMPFFDPDTSMLYLAGKGDGNIRYYEVVDEAPYIHYLTEFKSNTPQRGLCFVPKRAMNISECEVARGLKLGVKTVEPISFQVPRKGTDVFQEDLYPDCFSGDASETASDYFSGKNADVKKVSLSVGFVAKPKSTAVSFEVKEEKVLSEKELRDEVDKLQKRVSYLESEIAKKDAHIKELTK